MTKFRHHKYSWTKPFGSPRHSWEFIGPAGGVHFHVGISDQYGDSAGLEFHHSARSHFRCDEAPDHTKCWLTGEPCWHDGTSLYASDTLWPMIKPILMGGDHDAIFRILEREYESRFASVKAYERENAA